MSANHFKKTVLEINGTWIALGLGLVNGRVKNVLIAIKNVKLIIFIEGEILN